MTNLAWIASQPLLRHQVSRPSAKSVRVSQRIYNSPSLPTRSRLVMQNDSATPTPGSAKRERLTEFLSDAKNLGTIRFINISGGVVLETIGRFDYTMKPFDLPAGAYLTIASIDKTFECHINADKISSVSMSTEAAKIGGHDLHVIRLKDEEGKPLLSCLLMWDPSQGPGKYLAGAVEEFKALESKYGSSFSLAA